MINCGTTINGWAIIFREAKYELDYYSQKCKKNYSKRKYESSEDDHLHLLQSLSGYDSDIKNRL